MAWRGGDPGQRHSRDADPPASVRWLGIEDGVYGPSRSGARAGPDDLPAHVGWHQCVRLSERQGRMLVVRNKNLLDNPDLATSPSFLLQTAKSVPPASSRLWCNETLCRKSRARI